MIEFLKKRNRTLLELRTGIVVLGIICQIVGIIFYKNVLVYTISLWVGILMAILSSEHMYRTLDKALDFDEGTAKKRIYGAYIGRYVVLVAIFAVICLTGYLNPLVTFLGYMMLKLGALLQPKTHKIYNRIFHETDPIPLSQEEYDAMRAEEEKGEDKEN